MADNQTRNLHKRRSIRIPRFDYSQPGSYFITICTKNRRPLFGDIRRGAMELNDLGCLVSKYWREIPNHFEQIELGVFVVMPNHLHGILNLSDCTGTACRAPTTESFSNPVKGSLATIVRSFKSAVSKQFHLTKDLESQIWHRGYFEHIIRDDPSMLKISEYIETNPQRWELDRENLSCKGKDDFDIWLNTYNRHEYAHS